MPASTSRPLHLNSTLVCVIGNVRGGRLAHQSLVSHVLQPLQADLALLLAHGKNRGVANSEFLLSHATHVWRLPEVDDAWNSVLDELDPGWSNTVRPNLRDNIWGGVRRANVVWGGAGQAKAGALLRGSGAILLACRMILLGYLDALRGYRYRQVIVTRSDHFYGCDHPRLPTHANDVHIPEGEGYSLGGVTDRHAVFAFAARKRALSILPWFVRHDNGSLGNFEDVIGDYFRSQMFTVKPFPRTMAVVRAAGDPSRWSEVSEPIPGLCNSTSATLKYPCASDGERTLALANLPSLLTSRVRADEYAAMMGTCNRTTKACPGSDPTFARWLKMCAALESKPTKKAGAGIQAEACGLKSARRRCDEMPQVASCAIRIYSFSGPGQA